MNLRSPLTLLRVSLAATLLLGGLTLVHIGRIAQANGTLLTSPKWPLVLGLGGALMLAELILLGLTWTRRQLRLVAGVRAGLRRLAALGWANLLLGAALIAAFSFALLGEFGYLFQTLYARAFLFLWVVLIGAALLKAAGMKRDWLWALGAASLLAGLSYRAAAYLPEVNSSPFTLNWSEASRYYYASLFLSRPVYGMDVPPTVLHPSRYLMQAAPFLLPSLPILAHRLWQVILWLGMTGATSWMLARGLELPSRLERILVLAWASLFLLIGPVYYHLQVPLLLILWGFGPSASSLSRHFWKGLALVLVASLWAGISRVNWFPVPGMLAAVLYFLQIPTANKPVWKYLVPPLLWTFLGTAAAFGAQALYVLISGNPPEQFASSLSSDLLWYRLLPNPTYPSGILLSTLGVSLPLFLILFLKLRQHARRFHPLRLLGIGAILAVLLAGGMVVSVKIGGGSNLHNLDAYLALLMIVGAYFFYERFEGEPEKDPQGVRFPSWLLGLAVGLALLLPVYYAILTGGPLSLPTQDQTKRGLEVINRFIADLEPGQEVLFMGERQLLTFRLVTPVPLVPEYERVFLMEMVMAGNPVYLEKFHSDLKNHRFALIISEPLYLQKKGRQESFGEENDAWVKQVSRPVLCSYRPRNMLSDLRIQLLLPRAGKSNCP